jgi:hypothetical protein
MIALPFRTLLCAKADRLSEPNPVTSIYNASVAKIYSATNSLARF